MSEDEEYIPHLITVDNDWWPGIVCGITAFNKALNGSVNCITGKVADIA